MKVEVGVGVKIGVSMNRCLSSWILVVMTCLGIALLGFGCERTIDDDDFNFRGTGGVGGSGGTGGTGGDGPCEDDDCNDGNS